MSTPYATPWKDKLCKELRLLKPEEVCDRAGVKFSREGFYSIDSIGGEYRVYIDEERVEETGGDPLALDPEFQLTLFSYLIHAQDIDLTGKWISEKDLRGGSTFFRGPHQLPAAPLVKKFGRDAGLFLEEGKALGGKPLDFGDVSLEFSVLPRVPLTCVLWVEDEEFPARVSFLFDSSIKAHLELDVIIALVNSVVRKLLSNINI
ncbi:MAG: DUF3786 domain-containing protein [Deltaproteobacteria bacterium]|nr:DUF3786 domain-containing protein [Deltaproteobacteria bacterium]